MCPVIHVLPNGLTVPANDPLLASNVILPGVLITLALFVILSALTALTYRKLEAK
jgi:ABC-2 type transport system permease protein